MRRRLGGRGVGRELKQRGERNLVNYVENVCAVRECGCVCGLSI